MIDLAEQILWFIRQLLPRPVHKFEFTALACVAMLAWLRPRFAQFAFEEFEKWGAALANRKWLAMLCVAITPMVLRLALLQAFPVPQAVVYDEFSHLLVADTLVHGRLANPTHPLSTFFETIYVLHHPAYASVYPLGQGFTLAIGEALLGHPWAGVLLSSGFMTASIYWLFLGWVTPGWALLGGIFAILRLTVLTYWMNSYWGGTLAAAAGALAAGAAARLWKGAQGRHAVIVASGLTVCFIVRPFEAVLLSFVVLPYAATGLIKQRLPRIQLWGVATAGILAFIPGILLTLVHNREVTGNMLVLPYQLARRQHGVPQRFFFQSPVEAANNLTREQKLIYDEQRARQQLPRTARDWAAIVTERCLSVIPSVFGPTLGLFVVFAGKWRSRALYWPGLAVAASLASLPVYGFFLHHYYAPGVACMLLFTVLGMERVRGVSWRGQPVGCTFVRLAVCLVIVQFTILWVLHMFDGRLPSVVARNEYFWRMLVVDQFSRDRSSVLAQLNAIPGGHVVFVWYLPVRQHPPERAGEFHREWVYNGANIDASRVVWARSFGPQQDTALMRYYPNRRKWLLTAGEGVRPRIEPYGGSGDYVPSSSDAQVSRK